MKPIAFRTPSVGLFCLLAWALFAQAAPISLSGTVTDLEGKPLYGVGVHLRASDTATGTDSLGRWSLTGSGAGTQHTMPGRFAAVATSPQILIEGNRVRVRYMGIDASGRMCRSWTPPQRANPIGAGRPTAAAPADTISFSWNGRFRTSVMPASLWAGPLGIMRIDTATLATDIRWSTGLYRYGRLTDARDGQVYRTIAIGSQIWMAENLNFKVDSSARALRSPDSVAKLGRHYQWSAAMGLSASFNRSKWAGSDVKHQGACPVGWHVPSDVEWATLRQHIDPSGAGLGAKLRSVGGWKGAEVVAGRNDSFGFRAVPAGYLCCGDFAKADSLKASGLEARWWSASEGATASLAGFFGNSGSGTTEKISGYSLRCLNDTAAVDPYADVKLLPKDVGGVSTQVPKGTKTKPVGSTPDSATYGYHVYLPSGAVDPNTTHRFPMVVSVHGSGFSEDAGLSAQLGLGIHYLIANGKWKPNYPFIVASPQTHSDNSGWNSTELNNYIAYMVAHYPVDPKRVYLVGMSMGAMGIYNYVMNTGSKSLAAAAVPIAGTAGTTNARNVAIPLWAFHGAVDGNVSPTADKAFIAAVKTAHPELDVKITMFSKLGHEWNIWYYPYYPNSLAEETELDGRTDIEANTASYDRSIYDWMLLYKKS